MISLTKRAQEEFAAESGRRGKLCLGILINFLYGCGGAGFRAVITADPQGSRLIDADGLRIALDAGSRDRLQGAIIELEEESNASFVLRHPDVALVDFS